jgi:hypothetical protein
MRYRIRKAAKGLEVSVEDGAEVLVSVPAKSMKDAKALRDKAFKQGWQSLKA